MAVAGLARPTVVGLYKVQQLKPWLRDYVRSTISYLADNGIGGTVFDVYRSCEEQNRRFRLGDSRARCGESAHQYGLAFDFVVSEGEQSQRQRDLQAFWRQLGFVTLDWDPAHVEYPNWRAFR